MLICIEHTHAVVILLDPIASRNCGYIKPCTYAIPPVSACIQNDARTTIQPKPPSGGTGRASSGTCSASLSTSLRDVTKSESSSESSLLTGSDVGCCSASFLDPYVCRRRRRAGSMGESSNDTMLPVCDGGARSRCAGSAVVRLAYVVGR